jgi:hypothetical protein
LAHFIGSEGRKFALFTGDEARDEISPHEIATIPAYLPLAATTRATPAWVPSTMVSHHIYASWTWGILAVLWLLWHRKRFGKRDEED